MKNKYYTLCSLGFIFLFSFLLACNSDPRKSIPETGSYGKPFTPAALMTVEQVEHLADSSNNVPVQVSGTITNYCKGEGCWLTLKNKDGKDLLIEVKDKAFVLPYHIDGKEAVVNGIAVKGGESDTTLSVEADGILIK